MMNDENKRSVNATNSLQKSLQLGEIHYLISRREFKTLSAEDLEGLIQTIKNMVYKGEKYPIFRTERFIYALNGSLSENGFRATALILDEEDPFPSRNDIEAVMDYYEYHGSAKFSFNEEYDEDGLMKFSLVVSHPDIQNDDNPHILSPSHARILNLKMEGKTQKEIAAIEGCSVSTVVHRLHNVLYKSNRYGFWQIWPESVEMRFSDREYANVLRSRKKHKKNC